MRTEISNPRDKRIEIVSKRTISRIISDILYQIDPEYISIGRVMPRIRESYGICIG